MTLGQTVDTVIEEAEVEVYVTTYLLNEVVGTDSEAVTVTRGLPNGQLGVTRLNAGSYRTATTVDRVETVGVQVVRHTARAADTRDHHRLVGRNTYFGHRFLHRRAYGVITTARAETYVLIGFELTCFHGL